MQIAYREFQPGIVVITVSGKVLLTTECERVETVAADLLDQGYRKFIYDVSGVTHIDSTGIGRFIAALNRMFKVGGHLRIAAAPSLFRDSFRVTRLDTVFQFFPDVESAAASFA